jgi:orotate phosphoribosyltransferase
MIVDDVYTTGETLSHCAEVLVNAGLEPHVFTFARTVRAVPTQPSLDAAVRKERCR